METWHYPRLILVLAVGALALGGPIGFAADAMAAPTPVAASSFSVQIADTGLSGTRPSTGLVAAKPATPPRPPAGTLAPAPIPNQDIDAPVARAAPREPRLEPAFFSRKAEFEGDGFSAGSNLDYNTEDKDKPAAGLNLSVPVK
jgi:hypothetical protein